MNRPAPARSSIVAGLLAGLLASSTFAGPADVTPRTIYSEVAFDQKLGDPVPLELAFRDESGAPVRLGGLLGGEKPVILTLVYYRCPMLCNQVLNGVVRSLLPVGLDMGEDFDVVTVSIDPTETPDLARSKKAGYVRRYGRPGAEAGWHFLTGEAGPIRRLAEAVGFRYRYDDASKQFAHAAGICILTPDGRVSRYLYGINYPARDLQLGLVEASGGTIGSKVDQLLLFCFHYDPDTGRYNFAIMSLIQVLGTATALALGSFMLVMFRRDRLRAAPASPTEAAGPEMGRDRSESPSSP